MQFDLQNIPEIYFKDNFLTGGLPTNNMLFPDKPMYMKDGSWNYNPDYSTINEWIYFNFASVDTKTIGQDGTNVGRVKRTGLFIVYSYSRKKKIAVQNADVVFNFFSGADLGSDIRADIGKYGDALPLDNGFYELKMTFKVTQYS